MMIASTAAAQTHLHENGNIAGGNQTPVMTKAAMTKAMTMTRSLTKTSSRNAAAHEKSAFKRQNRLNQARMMMTLQPQNVVLADGANQPVATGGTRMCLLIQRATNKKIDVGIAVVVIESGGVGMIAPVMKNRLMSLKKKTKLIRAPHKFPMYTAQLSRCWSHTAA